LAVRQLKKYVSWVKNDESQFGSYLPKRNKKIVDPAWINYLFKEKNKSEQFV